MLLTEYNEAEAMELFRRDGYEEGFAEGYAEGYAEGLSEGVTALHAKRIMDRLGLTAAQALDLLGAPEEDREGIIKLMSYKG